MNENLTGDTAAVGAPGYVIKFTDEISKRCPRVEANTQRELWGGKC